MGYLKGKSELMIFEKHTNLKYKFGNRHFWSEGYYLSTVRRIQVLCTEGRIPGATKIVSYWAIHADAEKPNDKRIESSSSFIRSRRRKWKNSRRVSKVCI